MIGKIALITILASDVPRQKKFYEEALGFKPKIDHGHYVEFESEGVRFSICARSIMTEATGHASYAEEKRGQSFELAFPVNTPGEVDQFFRELVSKGAKPVKEPADMPWGQRTAFFADPEGNIHEIFSNL